ncbi:MAG TPA: hypothetical protein VES95_09850 [Dermatophilaceae bacterium]|nr:hypothetical protein [Dermatophilaceae bacterium]
MPSTHHRLRRPGAPGAVAAALLALALTGCGSGEDAPAAPAAPSATSAPAASVSASATAVLPPPAVASTTPAPPAPTSSPTIEPGVKSTPVTVQGTVSAREGKCLYFTVGDMAESWVLTGRTEGLAVGDQVEVTGAVIDTPDPACRDAMPFDVLAIRRL